MPPPVEMGKTLKTIKTLRAPGPLPPSVMAALGSESISPSSLSLLHSSLPTSSPTSLSLSHALVSPRRDGSSPCLEATVRARVSVCCCRLAICLPWLEGDGEREEGEREGGGREEGGGRPVKGDHLHVRE